MALNNELNINSVRAYRLNTLLLIKDTIRDAEIIKANNENALNNSGISSFFEYSLTVYKIKDVLNKLYTYREALENLDINTVDLKNLVKFLDQVNDYIYRLKHIWF